MELLRVKNTKVDPFFEAYHSLDYNVLSLYDGNFIDAQTYYNRLHELNNKTGSYANLVANREVIGRRLIQFHNKLASLFNQPSIHPKLEENICAYIDGEYTIVTGQQAGIFTGPIYTINKMISLLLAAKKLQKLHDRKIVPVFWIAGEDHDVDEIDRIYINSVNSLGKIKIDWNSKPRDSISNVVLSKRQLDDLIDELKFFLPDSEYKKEIIDSFYLAYDENTISIGFAALLYKMFAHHGVILIDSHDPDIRQEEIPFFETIIEKSSEIIDSYKQGNILFHETGFAPIVEVKSNRIGLYISLQGKRRPIYYDSLDELYSVEQLELTYSRKQLVSMVNESPHLFSTNVLLRPLIQEYLFQPITYVAGGTEFKYWGQLKPLFHLIGYTMPVVSLRNSYTYRTGIVKDRMKALHLPQLENILAAQRFNKDDYLEESYDEQYDLLTNYKTLEREIEELILKKISDIPPSYISTNTINNISGKYVKDIHWSIQRLYKELESQHHQKYMKKNMALNWLENELLPKGILQERILNIYQFINRNGYKFLDAIIDSPDHILDGEHYVVDL